MGVVVAVGVGVVSLAALAQSTSAPRHARPASRMAVAAVAEAVGVVAPRPPVRYWQRAVVVRGRPGPEARLGLVAVEDLPLVRCLAMDWPSLPVSRSFSAGGRLGPRSETLLG
jgi:hypothetical protein